VCMKLCIDETMEAAVLDLHVLDLKARSGASMACRTSS
jgi:hypothetical protein